MSSKVEIARYVALARSGDGLALRALYDSHLDAVYGYCRSFARGNQELARDLCQESFATAFSRLEQLEQDAAFPGWMRTITRRTCLRWAEQRRTEEKALDALAQEPEPPPAAGSRAATIVAEVIEACPDEALRQTALYFYTDPPRTTDEIAEEMGVSRTAVTTRLFRFRTWAKRRMLPRLTEAMEDLL